MTNAWFRASRLLLISSLMAVSLSCAAKTVRQITADPYRYSDREVSVSGRVTDSLAFANRGAYQIEDRTGRLWVVSERGAPSKDVRVTAKGTIRTAFSLGSIGIVNVPPALRSGTVLVETSRKIRD